MSAEILQLVSAARYLAIFIFVCCLPGLALSYLLFPPPRLDFLERLFIACSSSIALSSLLAVGLILLSGRFVLLVFSAAALLLTAIFFGLSQWRLHIAAAGNEANSSTDHAGKRQSIKPALLVVVLLVPIILFFPAQDLHEKYFLVDDQFAWLSSDITEFYISPQKVEIVLERIGNPQEEINIPLVIVNHNPEPVEYRIEIFNEDQITFEQSGISVSAGDAWHGNVSTPLLKSNHSSYIDIFLFARNSPNPVAQLRLWR